MEQHMLDETKFVLYDKKKQCILDVKSDPIFEDYGIVFNLSGQVLLTCAGQIIGYLGDRYELRRRYNKKTNDTSKRKENRV